MIFGKGREFFWDREWYKGDTEIRRGYTWNFPFTHSVIPTFTHY